MKAGAYDYISKPIDYDALVLAVHRAMERQNLLEEVRNLRSALDGRYGFENIVGRSKALLRVLEMASRVAQHDSTVLIRGETGTGKELLAHAIHHNSRRTSQPFVTINCGAIPKDLLESELFGYTRGAFTGALAAKPGRIEMADGGTLFLDEVGELPMEMQVKLLRLLQHGEIDKLGSTATRTVNVRVIAATNRNLQAMIEDGTFREDLYYRLAVVPLELPAVTRPPGRHPRTCAAPVPKTQRAARTPGVAIVLVRHVSSVPSSLAGERPRVGECDRASGGARIRRRHQRCRPAR